MSFSWRIRRNGGKSVAGLLVISGLVLMAAVSHADTTVAATDEALPAAIASDPDVSFWADAAPLGLVIRQLAHLSGRTAQIQEVAETEKLAESVASSEPFETDTTEIMEFFDVPVSGRFSGTLGNTLMKLSADYPVVFDLDGEILHAIRGDARSNISIAMLGPTLDEKFKNELLASSGAGNTVEFREDAVRVSGHPAFVKRQAVFITRALASAEVRLKADSLAATSNPALPDAVSVADSGSTEVLVDIQDEARPPAEQANLSKPIRWVTDIPGYNTF